MYPVIKGDIEIGTYIYDGEEITCIKNQNGDIFTVDDIVAEELIKADGTHPLVLDEEDIDWLIENDFLSKSRFIRSKNGNRFVLFIIDDGIKKYRKISSFINHILPFASIAFFIIGLYFRNINPMIAHVDSKTYYWLYIGLIIVSVIIHELAHMCAAISYDFKMHEFSITLFGVIPTGACVVCRQDEQSPIKNKLQFILAGVEANLLFTGLLYVLSLYSGKYAFTIVYAAQLNIIMVIVNLLPCFLGLDGEKFLSTLFNVNSIEQTARQWLIKKDKRYKLLHSGYVGYATLSIFMLCILSDIIFIFAIALDAIILIIAVANIL